jgi:Ran GTPase-activating protein (RanGAP) involved in mRNA processing and transport
MNNLQISITIPKSDLNQRGEVKIKYLLNKHPHINSLVFGNRKIGDKEIKVLGNILKDNKTINSLDLQKNYITDNGVKILADCLESNTTLTSINLLNNQITDSGVKSLANVLKKNVIDTLYLGGNYITALGVKDFKQNNELILSW